MVFLTAEKYPLITLEILIKGSKKYDNFLESIALKATFQVPEYLPRNQPHPKYTSILRCWHNARHYDTV